MGVPSLDTASLTHAAASGGGGSFEPGPSVYADL